MDCLHVRIRSPRRCLLNRFRLRQPGRLLSFRLQPHLHPEEPIRDDDAHGETMKLANDIATDLRRD